MPGVKHIVADEKLYGLRQVNKDTGYPEGEASPQQTVHRTAVDRPRSAGVKAFLMRRWRWAGRPVMRTVLCWCLPALIVGGALRAALWVQMPHAFYHPDSEQVFETYQYFLHGSLHIHDKKTPLGPLLYCLPPLLRLPVLPSIALVQHFLGLGIVGMVGALVANSFARWRLFIVPVTVLVAVNPILLWYEHVALPETFYVFSIVATALAGLLYGRRPDTPRLLALATALFFTAGFRPEGKLFCLFGIALAAWMTWGDWRRTRAAVGVMALLTVLCFTLNQTRQSGSLLYSNVANLTPAHLHSAPGFAEANREYFEELRGKWAVTPTSDIARERKRIFSLLRDYITARQGSDGTSSKTVNGLCSRIGAEVCLRNALRLPALALAKYRFTLRHAAAEDFGPDWLYRKQTEALAGDFDAPDSLAAREAPAVELVQILFGRDLGSRPELESYLRQIYRPFSPDWLTGWEERYAASVIAWRLPDGQIDGKVLPGLPWLYLLAATGLAALAWRDRQLRAYHLAWLGMLLLMAFTLTLTGSNLGRFRIGFEPFWFLYAFSLLDVLLGLVMNRKKQLITAIQSPPSTAEQTGKISP